jgi:hypothetical protein
MDTNLLFTEVTATSTSTSKKKVAPKNLIRTSAADRTLDSMFSVHPSKNKTQVQPQPLSQPPSQVAVEDNVGREEPLPTLRREGSRKAKEIPESSTELTSIKDLRKKILVREHQGIFTSLTFRSRLSF